MHPHPNLDIQCGKGNKPYPYVLLALVSRVDNEELLRQSVKDHI